MQFIKNSLVVFYSCSIVFITGCSGVNFTEWRFPYMYPVQQGNYLSQGQLQLLKPGMTKDQVSFVVGHPVSAFMFDSKKWQYIYQDYQNNKLKNSYVINLSFDSNDKLISIESVGKVFVK